MVAVGYTGSSAVDEDVVHKGDLVFSVRDYGATGDGVTNDVAAFNDAIAAATAAGGGIVYAPPGEYNITSTGIDLAENVYLKGAGPGATTILQSYWPNPAGGSFSTNGAAFIEAAGSLGAALSCSAVGPGVSVITGISSTAGLAAGDYLLLASQDAYWSGFATRYKGEIVRVASVDSASQVTIYGVTRDNYATTVTVSPMLMLNNTGMSDLTIRNTEPATTHSTVMAHFQVCHGVRVDNVELIGADYVGVRLTHCHDVEVRGSSMVDFTDDTPNSQFGYGILFELSTDTAVVDSCRFHRGRHAVTTGGVTPSIGGGPHNILIANCVATEMTETAFDTHQIGAGISFVGNQAIACLDAGFVSRSPDTRFVGNSVSWCKTGVVVFGQGSGIGHGTEIRSNVIRHCVDFGVRVYDPDRVTIADNSIDGTGDAGVYISDDATNLTIVGNRISNTGLDNGSVKSGIHFVSGLTSTGHRIERNTFRNGAAVTGESGSGPGNMDYAIRNLSAGVTGSWFAYNTATGLSADVVSDAGGNVQWQNHELDGTILVPDHAAEHQAGGADPLLGFGSHDGATRDETTPRWAGTGASLTLTSGTMLFAYFTAKSSRNVTTLTMGSGNSASGTVTTARMGLYSVDGSGNLTLLQGTVNDTNLFNPGSTRYDKTITSQAIVAGQRYAVGVIVVAVTAGTVRGSSSIAGISGLAPALCHALTGQTDLPASVAVGDLSTTGSVPWAAAS